MKPLIPLRQALTDPGILGRALGWCDLEQLAHVADCCDGRAVDGGRACVFRELTGRQTAPTERCRRTVVLHRPTRWQVPRHRGAVGLSWAAVQYARVPGELMTVVCRRWFTAAGAICFQILRSDHCRQPRLCPAADAQDQRHAGISQRHGDRGLSGHAPHPRRDGGCCDLRRDRHLELSGRRDAA